MSAGVLIAGGGLAAQRCAEALRRRGYEGPVTMLCAEPLPPYDRPPLSKEVLAGAREGADLGFRPSWWYSEAGVELRLGARAEALDPHRRRVRCAGEELAYEALVVATGGAPRELPFLAGRSNVHLLRTLGDARRLRAELGAGARLAVIGAGFIGQEVAATARRLGAEVTIVEALPAPLAGILGEELGGWFARLHADEGVEVLTGAAIESALGGPGRAERLLLAGGRAIECDAVVVGVGTAPAAAWLAGSGLDPDGVRTDSSGRTRLPGVFAAGDVCRAFEPRHGSHLRTEHWDAAAWQGAAVAGAILGEYPGTPPLPSFWSDQYGTRIQCVGHPSGADGALIEGDPGSRDFEVLMTRGGRPVAGLAVGRPRAIPAMKKAIDRGHWPAASREEDAA